MHSRSLTESEERKLDNQRPTITALIYADKGDGFIENVVSEEDLEVEIFVPASYATDGNVFHSDDVEAFFILLKDQLLSTSIVGSVSDEYSSNSLVIVVNFIVTSHDHHAKQYEAFMKCDMALRGSRRAGVYNVSASYADLDEGSEDIFERAKSRLMERVLRLMLEDISKFVDDVLSASG